jgi:uncharacterized protein YyaL (SSP411 family)
MLTDNAQLLDVALHEGDTATVHGVARFLLAVLRRDGGAFGAAQDSESWIDGVRSEGGYYLRPVPERTGLEPPAVDGKVITGWNGLAVGALARAGAALGEEHWIAAAEAAAADVLRMNRDADGALVRASLDGVPSSAVATDADRALLAEGLFALAAATGDVHWAMPARHILDEALAGGAGDDPLLLAQGIAASPDQTDGDLPSDAAAVASAALAAWRLGAGDGYRSAAADVVQGLAARALAQPFAHGTLLRVAADLAAAPRQLVVVTADRGGALAAAVRGADADVIAVVSPTQARAFADAGFELFEGKDAAPEHAFDCRAFVCRLPVDDPAAVTLSR